ncbi:sigma-70 family RNA polymerase sigma factor [Thalassoglobus polymorphus]|uniref:ECF RNA polymerase sigma factor SigD n=1 Tax=Thalassoglobus polymorphus TaxID=2527994 RepID=A0A517QTI0_9PLAN|nr:sigma-70 family RNA polymerase sigma factor [Thalassoglobus polymorphus]QDT34956.1 ECF RNA polymerase sigma factor SigD [Thalassoglobus polymorphus]
MPENADHQSPDHQDANHLIERIRQKDRDALAEFIELRRPQLLAFIDKRLSDRLRKKIEASDIFQDLSMSCLGSFESVDFEGRDPFRWLCQQAERRIIDAHRHHFGAQKRAANREVGIHGAGPGNEGAGIENDLAASMTSPSAAFSRNQKEFFLAEALEQLPDEAREALKLRYLQGMQSKEIAEQIGKSDAATRVLLSRSLKRMQEMLSENVAFQTLLAQNR